MFSPVNSGSYYKEKIAEADTQIYLENYKEAGYILHEILYWLPTDWENNEIYEIFVKLHDEDPEAYTPESIKKTYEKVKAKLETEGYTIPALVDVGIRKEWF